MVIPFSVNFIYVSNAHFQQWSQRWGNILGPYIIYLLIACETLFTEEISGEKYIAFFEFAIFVEIHQTVVITKLF